MENVFFAELARMVANDMGISKHDAGVIMRCGFDHILAELIRGNRVIIWQFGSFCVKDWTRSKLCSIDGRRVQDLKFKKIRFESRWYKKTYRRKKNELNHKTDNQAV